MNNNSKDHNKAKVLIFGLDNSSKTSILMSLQCDVNLLDFSYLKPTMGGKL